MEQRDQDATKTEFPELRLSEEFYSLQGEGELSGVPTYFIRSAGCSVSHCPLHPAVTGLCDTNWKFCKSVPIDELALNAKKSGAHWVCVTGGEPTDQQSVITQLAALIHRNGQRTSIQTSGVRQLADCWDWIVVSPKQPWWQTKQMDGHELKVIFQGQDFGQLRAWADFTRFLRYYLQPLAMADGSTNIAAAAKTVLRCGEIGIPFRLGVQQHKLWNGR